MAEILTTWNDGAAKQAIVEFVEQAVAEVPVEERVAVFDNDGTLWCEKPMPIQADFILRRLSRWRRPTRRCASASPGRRPTSATTHGSARCSPSTTRATTRTSGRSLGGVLAAYAGISVDDFEAQSDAFLRTAQHPTLGRGYLECAYSPMVELLAYLEANGFANYIASGGGRDFMRPISQEVYGIPRERVIGSATALDYVPDAHGGTMTHKPEADYLDDGPQKPIRIWSRTGRRPLLAAGNSNGDIPMLDFTRHADRPFLPLLVLHDDADREFAYTSGAEQALEQAGRATAGRSRA